MRKYYFLLALLVGGGWFLNGSAGLNPDGHVQSAGWSLPTLGIGQGQGILGMIGAMVNGHAQPPDPASAGPQTLTARATPINGLAAAEKTGDVVVPPELIRFMNPAMVTTASNGTQSLNPAAQAALQQIMAQAHANTVAVKEQPGAAGKATRVSR